MDRKGTITNQTLGFIGLGYLGSRIATRLIDAGFPLTVWNRDPEKMAAFSSRGVVLAGSASELARNVDVVLSCLTDDRAVEDVYFGEGKLLGTGGLYKTIIELSTVAPETSRRLHLAAERLGPASGLITPFTKENYLWKHDSLETAT